MRSINKIKINNNTNKNKNKTFYKVCISDPEINQGCKAFRDDVGVFPPPTSLGVVKSNLKR